MDPALQLPLIVPKLPTDLVNRVYEEMPGMCRNIVYAALRPKDYLDKHNSGFPNIPEDRTSSIL